jgi:putative transcriptional regulator
MFYTYAVKQLGIKMKTYVRKYRFLNGELSQQELSNQVKVSRQTIIAIEGGDYSPSVKLALLLAKRLNTTVEQLFELEDTDND